MYLMILLVKISKYIKNIYLISKFIVKFSDTILNFSCKLIMFNKFHYLLLHLIYIRFKLRLYSFIYF